MNSAIGLIGLGTMGAALAFNIAEKDFDIAVWNRTTQVARDFSGLQGFARMDDASQDQHGPWAS
ncbi:hypothetical protein ROLI_042420 [Roseobacter fucihabitans]|uniref:6-phosphogluconate dehydrogenase NADP-binding domain-containing protein n=1 Tax=Roseobacter fucihabitans TaxID=1537242 RepID=A0ABZ2BZD0_9RHOB|nr:6-phosphogluconate dehydrogenase [Roseobacter litoralis]